MDVEASRRRGTNAPLENPYSDSAAPLQYWHPINVLRRGVYIGISLYGLHYFNAYETILRDPNVSHEWFKFAMAASVGTCRYFSTMHEILRFEKLTFRLNPLQ